jgi:DnaD/phage-associated family protein
MPKYRQLHTKIIDSFDFNEMPDDFTRIVWVLLPLILDSEGRGLDNPSWIKSKMFPIRQDVSEKQISKVFDWFYERKMISRYEVNDHKYFFVPTFKLYQSGTKKESASVLPSPLITPEEVRSSSGVAPEEVRTAESASAFESESALAYESVKEHNIFEIYESEIGILTPMISEELDDIEKTYPDGWFYDAVKEAKKSTTRVNLKYILAILKRWKSDGKQDNNQKVEKLIIGEGGRVNL